MADVVGGAERLEAGRAASATAAAARWRGLCDAPTGQPGPLNNNMPAAENFRKEAGTPAHRH